MRPTIRRLAVGATIFLVGTTAVLASCALLLQTAPGREYLRRLLVARLSAQVNGRITIGRLGGGLPNDVVLHDVALTDSAGSLVFGAERIAAHVNVAQLFSKRIDVSRMEVDRAVLVLRHRRGGAWNVARVFARRDRNPRDAGGRGFGHWVRIHNAKVIGANVIVRIPWPADSARSYTLLDSAAARERERAQVERTPNGFEQVMRFRDIDALVSRVVLAHPDTARVIAEVANADMIAEPFRPPAADIRDLSGRLEITSDSLHFVGWRVVLPDSRMTVDVRYAPGTGALRGTLHAEAFAFRDLQWLYPQLPAEGVGVATIEAARNDSGPMSVHATELSARVGESLAHGTMSLAVGDTVRLTSADVRVERLNTQLVRRLFPRVRLPADGVLDARARIDTTAQGYAADGDVTLHDRRGRPSAFFGRVIVRRGGAFDVDGRVAPLSLGSVAPLAPHLGLHGSTSGRVRGTFAGDSVSFRMLLRVGEGMLASGGRVRWGTPGISYDVNLEPRSLDPRAVSLRLPRAVLTGSVSARGHGTALGTAGAEVSVSLRDVRLPRVALDSLRFAGRLADGLATLDTLAAWRDGTRLGATGTIGLVSNRVGTLHYDAQTDSLGAGLSVVTANGAEVASASASRPAAYGGRATIRGTAVGNVDSLRVAGRASLEAVSTGDARAARIIADYTMGLGRDDTLSVSASADSARVGRLSYDRADVALAGAPTRLMVEAHVRQDTAVSLEANAIIALDTTRTGSLARAGTIALRDVALRLPSGEWRNSGIASITWRDGGLAVDSLSLRSSSAAALTVSGDLPAEGDGALLVRVDNLPLSDVSALRQRADGVEGRLSTTTRITGTTASPMIAGSVSVTQPVVRGTVLPDVRGTVSYANSLLTAGAEVGDDRNAPLARASAELPLNLALVGVSDRRLSPDAPLRAEVRADSLPLGVLPLGTTIRVDSGWIHSEVRVNGTVSEPAVSGWAKVPRATAFIPDAGVTMRDISASARLTSDSLVLDSLVARSNGRIHLAGTVVRSTGGPHRVAGRLTARDAEVLGGSLGLIHADADLTFDGTTDSLSVTGRAEVLHGFVERKGPGEQAIHMAATGDPELFALIDTSLVVRRRHLLEGVRPKRAVHADVAVRIDPGVWYRSAPNAKVEVFTPRDLRIGGNVAAGDAAAGGVVLTRGGVYVFRLRPFELIRGGATLAGATNVAPLIQATGEHDVWIVGRGMLPVRFVASGFPSDVQFSLGDAAVLPAAPPDLASYLSLGRPPVSLLQSESSSLSGLSTSGGRFTGTLGALARRQQVSPALGAILYQLAKGARDAVGVGLFTVTPTDLPPELEESQFAGIRGTTMDAGYLLGSRTYLGARIRLSAVSPGVVVVHTLGSGLLLRAAYEPIFRIGEPVTLGPPREGTVRRAFGAFLTKEWWY